jgi:acyl-CoA thioester hydrolase
LNIANNTFKHKAEVRDSELDLQGIVNNSNYFVYMEHARHKHLKALGLDFKKLHDEGYDLVLSEVQMKFKASLVSGDIFITSSQMEKKGRVRVLVKQTITRESDNQTINEAAFTITCVNNKTGKIDMPEWILGKLFD